MLNVAFHGRSHTLSLIFLHFIGYLRVKKKNSKLVIEHEALSSSTNAITRDGQKGSQALKYSKVFFLFFIQGIIVHQGKKAWQKLSETVMRSS